MRTGDDTGQEPFSPASFDDWRVRVFAPLLLLALAWGVNASPLKFFMTGFHVWTHELGHSSAAWLSGYKATPLPIGWTPIEGEQSLFVYFGVLFLFGVLAAAGWRESRPAAVAAAVLGAVLQAWMTWRLPPHTREFWHIYGGVGGQFYLGALMMAAFFVPLPDWFKWGWCRYLVFFAGASTLLDISDLWRDVYRGVEEIPFGSLLHGEEDAGGDMNRLMDDFGWTMAQIRRSYYLLGLGCWLALAATYAWFTLRLDRGMVWCVRLRAAEAESGA